MPLAHGLEAFSPDRPKLLIVEGEDDQQVLLQLLTKHLRITDIEIRDTEGTGNLDEYLDVLRKLSDYHWLRTIAVLHDSDETPDRAFGVVKRTLEKYYPDAPSEPGTFAGNSPRVGALVLSDGDGKCTLEHVCLASATRNPQCLACVDAYLECLELCSEAKLHPNRAKHKAHAYLASLPDPTRNLGQAASDGVWDFDHESWAPLKQFLLSM